MDQNVSNNNLNREDDFIEASPHGEIVMFIARLVGLIVLVVAIVSSIMIMMVIRSILAFFLHKLGVTIVSCILCIIVCSVIKFNNLSFKILWTMLTQSCA
jgi:hypothetical protein